MPGSSTGGLAVAASGAPRLAIQATTSSASGASAVFRRQPAIPSVPPSAIEAPPILSPSAPRESTAGECLADSNQEHTNRLLSFCGECRRNHTFLRQCPGVQADSFLVTASGTMEP
jgi:hypothetical protein